MLALEIVYEIAKDRRTTAAIGTFLVLALSLLAALVFLALGPEITIQGKGLSQALIVCVAVLLAQGYAHQINRIRKAGETGAVSWWMHFLTMVKDVSTIAFAVAMGLSAGWPMIIMCSVSISTKVIILWQFEWVKRSPIALARREVLRDSEPHYPSGPDLRTDWRRSGLPRLTSTSSP